jgi:hypothetical protein
VTSSFRDLFKTKPELIAQATVRQLNDSSNRAFEFGFPEAGGHRMHPILCPTKRQYSEAKRASGKNSHSFPNKYFVWRASLPPSVTTKVLELSGLRFPGGWKWIFKTYNSIPLESKAVVFAESGDIQGLQRLFASKQASPFDRIDTNGYTLLHVSLKLT